MIADTDLYVAAAYDELTSQAASQAIITPLRLHTNESECSVSSADTSTHAGLCRFGVCAVFCEHSHLHSDTDVRAAIRGVLGAPRGGRMQRRTTGSTGKDSFCCGNPVSEASWVDCGCAHPSVLQAVGLE